jgi:ELWxxDGT repeat protein
MLFLLGIAMNSHGQEISMVTDLNLMRRPISNLDFSYILNDKLYYGSTLTYEFDGINPARIAYELDYQYKAYVIMDEAFITTYNSNNKNYAIWRYNGTKSPVKLADFNSVSVPNYLTIADKNLFFFLCDSNETYKLWVFDSTNTFHSLYAISHGKYDSVPRDLIVLNNKLYYTVGNKSIWEYDQISAPSKIAEFDPGYPDGNLVVYNNHLYFRKYDPANGSELWSYDGINPPILAFDISKGNESSSPMNFAKVKNKLYFNTHIGLEGYQIWEYDGINPPRLAKEFEPGNNVSQPYIIKVINDKLYFTFDYDGYTDHILELWVYDGLSSPSKISAHQTSGYYFLTALKDKVYYNTHQPHIDGSAYMCDGINPPEHAWLGLSQGSNPRYLNVLNDKLSFIADDGIHGSRLWNYDGNNDPAIVSNIPGDTSLSENSQIIPAGNKLFIVDNKKLMTYNGNDPLVEMDINESEIYPLMIYNDKLYYSAAGTNPLSLKVFDGVNAPVDLASNASCTSKDQIIYFHNKIYFSAHDDEHGIELWVLNEDNTETMLADLAEGMWSSNPDGFIIFRDKLFFIAGNKYNTRDLWVLDGSGFPTQVKTGLNAHQVSNLCIYKNRLYFVAGTYPYTLLWSYDGTDNISLIFPENITSGYQDKSKMLFLENGKMYILSQYEHGYFGDNKHRLWEYDGNASPKMIIDFSYIPDIKPGNFSFIRNNLYYSYKNLWEFDGINPPVPLKGKNNDFFGTDPESFTEFKGKMYFTADQPGSGRELFALTLPDSMINVQACNYFDFNGDYLAESGIYYDTIPGVAGHDSIVRLNLIVTRSTSSIVNTSVCDAYSSPSGKYLWKSSGTYTDTIPNAAGCDSVITIHLTVNFSTSDTVNVSACDGYVSPDGRFRWTRDGTYYDTISNVTGCDSVITIHLQIGHVDTSVYRDRNILISNDQNASHQWINCDEGNVPVAGETFLTYTARTNGHYAVIVSDGVCVDTSAVYEVIGTGISNPSESMINLYPNPTSGKFAIDLGKVYPEAQVTITRYDGQVIRKESVKNRRTIETEIEEPPGIYLVTILGENMEVVFRVVKRQ